MDHSPQRLGLAVLLQPVENGAREFLEVVGWHRLERVEQLVHNALELIEKLSHYLF